MSAQLLLTLATVFVSVALLIGGIASLVLARSSAGRRRLSEIVQQPTPSIFSQQPAELLAEASTPFWDRLADSLPTSHGTVKRLRRQLSLSVYHGSATPALFSLSELILPVLLAVPPLFLLQGTNRYLVAAMGAIAGYLLPGF